MNKDILICIFNYRNDENAMRWLELLSPHFDTRVLDSGNDKFVKDFVQFPNIFYSGLFNEMKKISDSGEYSWVGLICSDVTIEDCVVDLFIERLKWLKTTENVGQYQPSFDSTSYKWRGNNTNDKYTFEGKHLLDGPIIFMKNEILRKYPYIDTNINLYGCGIGRCFSVFCERNGYINLFDNTVHVHHPIGTGYEKEKSMKHTKDYIEYFKIFYGMTDDELEKGRTNNSIGDVSSLIKITKDNAPETKKKRKKKVVYTCITGNYDRLLDLTKVSDGFDYICFSDTVEYNGSLWNIRPIPEELKGLSDVKQQRIIKICPHKYLQEYDLSVWIDGNIDVGLDLDMFIDKYCSEKKKSVFIPQHPRRDCIYEEMNACARTKKDTWDVMYPRKQAYLLENFPEHYGLVQTGVMIRKHNKSYCVKLMNMWANEVYNYSHRDQLSFNYCLWKLGESGFSYLPSSVYNKVDFRITSHGIGGVKQRSVRTDISPSLVNATTYIFDCGLSWYSNNYKNIFGDISNVDVTNVSNGKCSDGFNKIIKDINERRSNYIIVIKSNVNAFSSIRIGEELIRKIKDILKGKKDIGIYAPSFISTGGVTSSSIRKTKGNERVINTPIYDGMFIINTKYITSCRDFDFTGCPSGSGFIDKICDIVRENGGIVVVDDSVYCTLSYVRGYSQEILEQQKRCFMRRNSDEQQIVEVNA